MNTKKNIDRLFQEKFKDFEVAPNDAVWNRINESLPNKKKKRRVIALWWQVAGVAAVITLLLTVGISVFNDDGSNGEEFPVVNTEDTDSNPKDNDANSSTDDQQDKLDGNTTDKLEFVGSDTDKKFILDKQENNNSSTPKKANISNQLTTPNRSQSNAVVDNTNKKVQPSHKLNNLKTVLDKENTTKVAQNTSKTKTNSKEIEKAKLSSKTELNSVIKNTVNNKKTATVDNSSSKKNDSESSKVKNSELNTTENSADTETSLIEMPKKESITDAIAENNKEVIDEKEEKESRWSISPNVAPVYYSSLGKGSPIDQQFNDNSKSSDINMSYGITGSYAVSKKLKVRAGINRVNLSQSTSEVFAIASPNSSPSSSFTVLGGEVSQKYVNITLNSHARSVSLMSAKSMVSASDFSSGKMGNMDQRIGFIEIPLELEYRVLDKKFGINVIGGFSTFFLNQNEIYADIDGASTLIGEANNINSTSYSANIGLGLDYSLSKQWNINLEPQFKYQLNTFNNTSGDFRPFFIGVYTGLSFKF